MWFSLQFFFIGRIDSEANICISDFGLSKNLANYEKISMYFRQEVTTGEIDIKLPIKWMALESIYDAVSSEKSDVVRQGRKYSTGHVHTAVVVSTF